MPCTPGGTTTPLLGLCKPAAGETPWTTAVNGNWDILDGLQAAVVARGYLAGLVLSTAGASATTTVAPGQAVDSANASVMVLAGALNKTTSAWAVGNNNGGLDTGSIAASTWYHFFLIKRVDTNVVDVVFSLSATSPTMPTSYTLKRRIGSEKTDGSSQWTKYVQEGDWFLWDTPVLDVNDGAPGTSAVTRTLTVPPGVVTWALVVVSLSQNTDQSCYLSSLDTADLAPGSSATTIETDANGATTTGAAAQAWVKANTSAQIRSRMSANFPIQIATLGWRDTRGRDA